MTGRARYHGVGLDVYQSWKVSGLSARDSLISRVFTISECERTSPKAATEEAQLADDVIIQEMTNRYWIINRYLNSLSSDSASGLKK